MRLAVLLLLRLTTCAYSPPHYALIAAMPETMLYNLLLALPVHTVTRAYLFLWYLGFLSLFTVFGRWKTTEYLGLRVCLHDFFLLSLAAARALDLGSFPATRDDSKYRIRHRLAYNVN